LDVRLTGSDRAERFEGNATHRVSGGLKKRDLKRADKRQINGPVNVSGTCAHFPRRSNWPPATATITKPAALSALNRTVWGAHAQGIARDRPREQRYRRRREQAEALHKARQGLRRGQGINKVAREVGLSNSTVARLKAGMAASA